MRRRPIGQILVEKQAITEEELAAALAEQERTGRKLGEILIESGQMSWLVLARAMAEQVLDLQPHENEEAETPVRDSGPGEGVQGNREVPPPRTEVQDPVELVKAMAEKVANLPPVPDPLPPPHPGAIAPAQAPPPDPERELARALAEQVANLDSPAVAQTHLLRLTPSKEALDDPQTRMQSIEAMLRERQRAFIELVTTAETLRSKVAWLEDQLEERNRELARLRLRAS